MLEYEAIVARIRRDGPDRILDWGCGWGQVSDLLRRAGLTVESFDYGGPEAPNAVVELPRFPGLSAYVCSDPIRLPYPEASFDAVLSCGVLEHVEDPDGSLEELKRVLRPAGTLYVYKLPNRSSYLERIARTAGLYYHGQAPNDRLYTIASAHELLTHHGFEVLEIRYANMLPLTLTGRAASLVAPALWAANRALARVPMLNRFATNVELVGRAPVSE
jgi:2-polyprenyl-3-methyl-5-hydroxy-6-metoxy-1,4-benzoquinol methylase